MAAEANFVKSPKQRCNINLRRNTWLKCKLLIMIIFISFFFDLERNTLWTSILTDIRHSSGLNDKTSVQPLQWYASRRAASSLLDCCVNATSSNTFGEPSCSLFSFLWPCHLLHVRGATWCRYHHLDGTEPNHRLSSIRLRQWDFNYWLKVLRAHLPHTAVYQIAHQYCEATYGGSYALRTVREPHGFLRAGWERLVRSCMQRFFGQNSIFPRTGCKSGGIRH